MAEQRVEAVERALSILETFEEGREVLALSELSARTGLYKSTILRLCGSLERFGYLTRGSDGRFRLGPGLWRLGSLYRKGFDLGEQIRPELRLLVDATEETASFYVREGDERICLYRLNSPRSVRHHLDEGVRLPLMGGATGRVLLAYGGEPGDAYEAIRTDGFCVSVGERDPEVAAVAVPVIEAGNSLRGALSVSGLVTRFDQSARQRALEVLGQSARRLAQALPRAT